VFLVCFFFVFLPEPYVPNSPSSKGELIPYLKDLKTKKVYLLRCSTTEYSSNWSTDEVFDIFFLFVVLQVIFFFILRQQEN